MKKNSDKETLRKVRENILMTDYVENLFKFNDVPEQTKNKIRSNFREELYNTLWPE